MSTKKIVQSLLFALLCLGCNEKSIEVLKPQIIPIPDEVLYIEKYFELSNLTVIKYPKELEFAGSFLYKILDREGSKEVHGASNEIRFILDSEIKNNEGYSIEISKDQIEIRARSAEGAFYAVQTFRQLVTT